MDFKDLFKKKQIKDDSFFNVDSTGSLHFMMKRETEIENQVDQRCQKFQQISLKTLEATKLSVSKTQNISNAFENCLQTSSNFCDVSFDETPALLKEKGQSFLQPYSSCPPVNRELNTINAFSLSPDILNAKPCVGLDLIASNISVTKPEIEMPSELHPTISYLKSGEHKTLRIMFTPQVIVTPDDAITKILEAESTALQDERTQPDGYADIMNLECLFETSQEEQVSNANEVNFKEDNLDGVLDSISHDLDYLLNRSEDAESGTSVFTFTRKLSKLPGASAINKLSEED